MRKTLLTLSLSLAALSAHSAPFAPGNIVVLRIGDGVTTLSNTGSPLFLDEYLINPNPPASATLVQSIALPTVASGDNRPCIGSSTGNTEGLLTRSSDRRYLVLTCYGRALGGTGSLSGTAGIAVPRVIARIDFEGTINSTTALTDAFSAGTPRSVASDDGTRFWAVGSNTGLRFATLGASTSTQLSSAITNLRQVTIDNGALLISHATNSTIGRVAQVGSGLPTSGDNPIAGLANFPITGSPYGFARFDLIAARPGADTLYVSDDSAVTGGVQKYVLTDSGWGLVGTITNSGFSSFSTARPFFGRVIFGTAVQYALINNNAELIVGVDTATGLAPDQNFITVATATLNQAMRGVVEAPEFVDLIFANGFQ